MFTNRIIVVALFTIAIASLLVAVSGFVGYAFAVKKKEVENAVPIVQPSDTDNSNPSNSSANTGDSSEGVGKTNGVSAKGLEEFLKCESDSAANGDLKRSEVIDCYLQAFTLY